MLLTLIEQIKNEQQKNASKFVYVQEERKKKKKQKFARSWVIFYFHTQSEYRIHPARKRYFVIFIYFREFGNKTRAYLEWTERMRIV